MHLDVDEGLAVKGVSNDSWRYPSFTVEMETGTGKTYVYLRTIHELRRHYGFRKFVIVVPSVAIYEGVVKNHEVTRSHFAALYSNETVNLVRYDGSRLSALRSFATSTFVEVLVMTIQSFQRSGNKIYRPSEQLPGELLPYEYIQQTRPILILDEPQNLETPQRKAALRTLQPLCALRYSATHRVTPNHLYSLTPFEAYRRGLVKKVQVDAVTERDNFNQPFLALQGISRQRGITATVKTYVSDKGRTREGTVTLRQADDLYEKTGREEHQGGYVVREIHAGQGFVHFENGLHLHLDETVGPARPEIFRVQIERTVLQHMQRQAELLEHGIKVLSLFFIDRVANYVEEDGIIRRLFDQAYEKYRADFAHYQGYEAHQVREGYFAQRTRRGETEYLDTDGRNQAERQAEKAAFELIMQAKEKLLSLQETPVSFIFAHSALKEGWDNPNVFQICTLNQTVSTMKKRQEIGRGLRLPVNQDGERIFDDDVNVLTVVANESYQSYAENLQQEYVDDGHATAPPQVTAKGKATVYRKDELFHNAHFGAFWEKLMQRTTYRMHIDTPVLIEACVERLNNAAFPQPVIVIERGDYVVTAFTVTFEAVRGDEAKIRVQVVDTRDNERAQAAYYRRRADLAKVLNEARLRGFQVKQITAAGKDSEVLFQNGVKLALQESYTSQSQAGPRPRVEQASAPEPPSPVFNLIERAARETSLTRTTLNTIFRRLNPDRKEKLPKNPEGFAATFIAQIKEELANHVAERIEFQVAEAADYEVEALFPAKKEFPQRELVPAGAGGLYDRIQVDSGVEERFVADRLDQDQGMICYFKFPPAFRVHFPKMIGNYNPDWGILRRDGDGRTVLELVRETKGTEELAELQFPHERRKIVAARKRFERVGIDYRVVTDETVNWWWLAEEVPEQEVFGR